MICPPCRRGGVLNADAGRVADEQSAEWLRTRALEEHGECWSRDCACQHQAGTFINPEAT